MPCTFDRGLVALYAGDDLPLEEAGRVEYHLVTCKECTRLLAEFRKDIELIAESGEEVCCPSAVSISPRPTRQRLRWGAVAVFSLLTCFLVGILPGVPVRAALLKSLNWIKVQVLSPKETKEMEDYGQDRLQEFRTIEYSSDGLATDAQGKVVGARPTKVSVDQARALAGFHLLLPTYLPQGIVLKDAWVVPGHRGWPVVIQDVEQSLDIYQSPPGLGSRVDVQSPEKGSVESVTVAGQEAVVVRGHWGTGQDGKFKWQSNSSIRLIWFRENQFVELVSRNPEVSVAELIRVAESLR